METTKIVAIVCFTLVIILHTAESHGRMMEPPMRASVWRFREFDYLNPPVNWDDDSNYCGSISVQHNLNGGKCGLCGDNYAKPVPRDNEDGGRYGRGIIVRNYTHGEWIPLEVELTAAHLGHFEFHLCSRENRHDLESEQCFEKHPLFLENGSYKLPVSFEKGWYKTKGRLPFDVTCSRCVLRWHYRSGNNWGKCEDGTFQDGCGDQETFRGCADVSVF